MSYKKFSQLKKGDTIYFLIDKYNILKTSGNGGVGFANENYGLVICSRTFTTDTWYWHSPRTNNGHLTDIMIDKEISCSVSWQKENEVLWGQKRFKPITKEEGEKSCLQFECSNSNYYRDGDIGYMFTTKDELEERVKEVIKIVKENLNKIENSLQML